MLHVRTSSLSACMHVLTIKLKYFEPYAAVVWIFADLLMTIIANFTAHAYAIHRVWKLMKDRSKDCRKVLGLAQKQRA